MTRIALFADLHANLPALKAILKEIEKLDVREIISLGDNIAIGPRPAECLDLMRVRGVKSVLGNHEEYFLRGLDDAMPDSMGDGEREHQLWTHERLTGDHRAYLASLPYSLERQAESLSLYFCHAPFAKGEGFTNFTNLWNGSPQVVEEAFIGRKGDVFCFGHSHVPLDLTLYRRFVNPGSVGCHKWSYARFTLLEIEGDRLMTSHHQVPYDKEELKADFERLTVPEREIIGKIFFHWDNDGAN